MQESGDETMVYDLNTDKAYLLNETSAFVWQMCNGENDLAEISRLLADKTGQPADENIVKLAIDQLRELNLMAEETPKFFSKTSRRQALKQIGLATMVALPAVFALTAPAAARAASGQARIAACRPCTAPAQCASNNCASDVSGTAYVCSNGSSNFYGAAPGTTQSCSGGGGSTYCCSGRETVVGGGTCTCAPV